MIWRQKGTNFSDEFGMNWLVEFRELIYLLTVIVSHYRVRNFPMKFSDQEIARETEFPNRASREIGKYLCTCAETIFFLTPKSRCKIGTPFKLGLKKELDQR